MTAISIGPFSAPGTWFRGNLHTHTTVSDGDRSPAAVVDWYRQRGYHFLAITDPGTRLAILASEKGYNRLMEAVKILQGLQPTATAAFDVEDWKKQCYAAMNDDFNSPILIAHLFDAVKAINLAKEGKAVFDKSGLELLQQSLFSFLFEVLGLPLEEQKDDFSERLSGTVHLLIELREEARINKNWALSDQIRDKLLQLGTNIFGHHLTKLSLESIFICSVF